MIKRKEKAFTLIELIAVLVIMAIIALIVTPLVMSIIRKARISADKRSIDAYGRSIELAIAGYLMDTGDFPTSISELTIEYSGEEIVCSTTNLNSDSSVYLAGCTVGGRSVEDYTYGKEKAVQTYTAYQIGDTVTYNNINYYVIKDSSASEDSVTLLKAEPLTAEEITTYSAGTGAQTNGNGDMQYGEASIYLTSYIKTILDTWANAKVPNGLQEARLISIDDLKNNLGYELDTSATTESYIKSETTPNWIYSDSYHYWTMTPYQDSASSIWYMSYGGMMSYDQFSGIHVVRPVIVLDKSVL